MGNIVSDHAFYPPENVYNKEDFTHVQSIENEFHHSVPFIHIQPRKQKFPFIVIYCHGNAEDIVSLEYFIDYLSNLFGIDFILFDYPGYSFSVDKDGKPIKPSERFCFANADAICNYVENDLQIPPKFILSYGKSLGSGLASYIAKKHPEYAGVILQSPLLSAMRVVSKISLPFDIFCNIDRIKHITIPTYIIHGKMDSVIDFSHGQKLYDLSKAKLKKCLWLDDADHNDVESKDEKLFNASFFEFLASIQEIMNED